MGSSIRRVVVDTNVILFDALAVCKFKDAYVHIPMTVIEEIDKFKRDLGENGRNARHFSRFIDVLRSKGPLAKGVTISSGSNSIIFIEIDREVQGIPKHNMEAKADNRILMTALALQNEFKNDKVELVTKDINLRIKADVFGVVAKDYEPEKVSTEEMYTGHKEIDLNSDQINTFYKEKFFPIDAMDMTCLANQYLIAKDPNNPNHSAVGRFDKTRGGMIPLITVNEGIWGIHPRNVEQSFALDALLNDEILFVSLVGKAGTGKTLLALAKSAFSGCVT